MKKIKIIGKKIFWMLPLSPRFKEKMRMAYATNKDIKERKKTSIVSISNNLNRESFIEQVLRIPNMRQSEYVDFKEHPAMSHKVSLVAYYLTQFHPTPQNDEWWGRGTTEWTNVSKAVPQFVGHYQPRIPGELGYYDLRLKENFERQIELAHNYGIEAFCFYYYWFDGERLLERPLNLFLKEKSLDIKFCYCWANENWTRRFTGTNTDILMKIGDTKESCIRFIYDIVDDMKDSRYFRIAGRPVLSVYRPSLIKDCSKVLKEWRKVIREKAGSDAYLIAVQEKGDKQDWCALGYDAETEFQPKRVNNIAKDITGKIVPANSNFMGVVYDYKDLVESKKYRIKENENKKVYPAVMPMWDNTARKDSSAIIYHGSTPSLYGTWLKDAVEQVDNNDQIDNVVFINAWNEWGEGTYLEPDRGYGYAYLESTYQVLKSYEGRNE